MNLDRKKKFLVYIAYVFVVVGILYFILKFCLGYLLPFIVGTVLAFLVQKPAYFISNKLKIKKGTAALCCVILIYLALVLILLFAGSRIYLLATSFAHRAPELIEKLTDAVKDFSNRIKDVTVGTAGDYGEYISDTLYGFAENLLVKVSEWISSFFARFAASLPSVIFSVFVTVITGCYIAKDFEKLKENTYFALGDENTLKIRKIWGIAVNNVFKIMKGYLILAFIAFVQLAIGFLILEIDGAVKVAVLTAFVDMLPVLGSGTVLIPWAVVAALTGKATKAIGLVIIYAVVTVVRNIMEPKIMGKQVGLHPVVTLLSMVLGLKIFGFAGLFALPLIVTVGYHYMLSKVTENI
ncbi:MAG: sporulation integral membrane protein YtvI [Acutalibacteraceae bacterium]|nr:sporulation integral membrane protein YtvI [Acutalibacteraceae bacterium]